MGPFLARREPPLIARLGSLPLALVASGVISCAPASVPSRFETTTSFEDTPRRAPGVAVDHAPALPSSRTSADVSEGVLVLGTPGDASAAREVVREFFRAVLTESPEQFEGLLAKSARVRSTSHRRELALRFWTRRLQRLDYGQLGGRRVYRDTEIETYRGEDLAALDPPRRFPIAVPPHAVLVKVRVTTARVGRTRLFGDEILFLLRPIDGKFTIAEMVEDFQIP